jgi:hypothetical protein
MLNVIGVWSGLNLQGCFKDWCGSHPKWHMFPSIVCWQIWLERNLVIFEEGQASKVSVVHMILGWIGRSQMTTKTVGKTKIPPYLNEGRPIGWFDGAAQRRGQTSGAGGVIRVNNHTKYRWMLNCGPGSNTRAELLGVWAC